MPGPSVPPTCRRIRSQHTSRGAGGPTSLPFEGQKGGSMHFHRIPVSVPQVRAWTNRVRPSLPHCGDEVFVVRDQNQRVFLWGNQGGAWKRTPPGEQFALTPGKPPPLQNTMDGEETTVKSRTATPHPQRRSTGSLVKEPPVPSRNTCKQYFLDHSSK